MSDDEDLFEVFSAPVVVTAVSSIPTVPSPDPILPHAATTASSAPILSSSNTSIRSSNASLPVNSNDTSSSAIKSGLSMGPPPCASAARTAVAPERSRPPTVLGNSLGSSGPTGGGLMILHSTSNALRNDSTGTGPTTKSNPLQTHMELQSRIAVRRVTRSFEQFPVLLSQYPFIVFDRVRAAMRSPASSLQPLACTCVGVVTRKTDPKQGSKSRYAVVTLWNMCSGSPSSSDELAFLLCGGAFDVLYTQLMVGAVVAVHSFEKVQSSSSSSSSSGGAQHSQQRDGDFLIRLSDPDNARLLGFAADLGTCESTSHKTGERCASLINKRQTKHCSYHTADLSKVVRGLSASSANGFSAKAPASAIAMKGGAVTMRLGGAPASMTTAQPRPRPLAATAAAIAERQKHPKVLSYPGFLAVRGVSGLPVGDAQHTANRLGTDSDGVYGSVHRGAPLAISKTVPKPEAVGGAGSIQGPTARSMNVTSRGRTVLDAARQQEAHKEHQRLISQALEVEATPPAARKRTHGEMMKEASLSTTDNAMPVSRTRTAASTAFTSGVKTATPISAAAALPSVPVSNSNGCSGMSQHKESTMCTTRELVESIKRKFAPVDAGRTSSFLPLKGTGAAEARVLVAQRDCARTVVTQSAGGQRSALVAAVAGALQREAPETFRHAAAAASAVGIGDRPGSGTLLGRVADGMTSSHDHLRAEEEDKRLNAYLDRQIEQEKAIKALEAVITQKVRAVYCYGCGRWYSKATETCLKAHHRTETRTTLKHYVQCSHCNYKTFVVGDDARAWKTLPRCPRCHRDGGWKQGNAAPEVRGQHASAEDGSEMGSHPY